MQIEVNTVSKTKIELVLDENELRYFSDIMGIEHSISKLLKQLDDYSDEDVKGVQILMSNIWNSIQSR